MTKPAYSDPDHVFNSAKYHSKFPCDVRGCTEPSGTYWSPYWCFKHNVERMDRITASLNKLLEG